MGIIHLHRLFSAHERAKEEFPYDGVLRQLNKTVEAFKTGSPPLSAYADLDKFKEIFEKFKEEYDPSNKESIKTNFVSLLPPKLSSRFS